MNEDNLANTLDRILAEGLREFAASHPKSPRQVMGRMIRWVRHRTGIDRAPVQPNSPCQAETIARIHSLPAHVQEALRRYFVFREAEESICFSIGKSPREFRRFLRAASGYVIMRQERMPDLKQRQSPDEG